MDFTLSEEQEMLRKSARDFLGTECPKSVVKEIEAGDLGYSPEIWKKMAELGWMGIALPEEHGGADLSLLDLTVENSQGQVTIVPALKNQFGAEKPAQFVPRGVALFDWAYALTAHKSQGSEFGRVAVYEELGSSWDPRRWRYTSATRAKSHLTYICPK